MSTIITRAGKGSPLTNNEVDANFVNLNTDKVETVTSVDGSIVVLQTGTNIDLAVSTASPASTLLTQVRNTTGATLTKGTVVYISGATGQISTVSKANASSDATSAQTLGMITADLANNTNGYVTVFGLIQNINTSAYTDGAQLYLSGTVAGTVTATKPSAPIHIVYVAIVEYAHPTQGKLLVKVQNGYELAEIHDVSIVSPTTGQTLVYDSVTDLWSNSNAPIITGGTIDNTTIGATTPNTGVFTTLTAQNEVLKGTGQNLAVKSQQISTWGVVGSPTLTGNASTAPDGTTTATQIAFTTSGNGVYIFPTLVNGATCTYSLYVKNVSTATSVKIGCDTNPSTATVVVDVTSGVITSTAASITSSSITSVGSGWYRVVFSFVATSSSISSFVIYNNSGTSQTLLAWGAQAEISSTAGTYIPTTTTAVYGTPTLSFSGVASIGLQSDGSLYETSAGTGNVRFYTNNIAQEQARVSHTASAVNYHQLTGSATGSGPIHSVAGSDTNIDLNLTTKGTGVLNLNTGAGTQVRIIDSGGTAVNRIHLQGQATGFLPIIASRGSDTNLGMSYSTQGTGAHDFYTAGTSFAQQVKIAHTASAVNYHQLTGGATTKGVIQSAQGSDTNISQVFQSKGTGAIDLAAGSSGVNISNGSTVTAITRTANGSYTSMPTAVISAPTTAGGTQATLSPLMAGSTATVVAGGTGYTVGDTLTIVGATGTASQFTVATLSGSAVATVTFTTSGSMSALPSNPVSVTGGTGSGATFNMTYSLAATQSSFTAGSGYVEQPTVTFSGGGGSGAAAFATVGSATVVRSIGSTAFLQVAMGTALELGTYGANSTNNNRYGIFSSAQFNPAIIEARGSDTNIDAVLSSKGTAPVRLITNSFSQGTGADQLRIAHTASAVNYLQVTGNVTGSRPTISSQGSDSNIGMNFLTKGNRAFTFLTNNVTAFEMLSSASSVNYFQVNGGATGFGPVLQALGSDTNIPAVVQPKGTGALQAQQTDSTATGGNARGANAVDWQTIRSGASQVAAGQYGVVSGGISNTVNSVGGVVGGGSGNFVSSSGYVGGIFSGLSNQSNGFYSPVVGGASNQANGYYNFIGGGFTNTGTASAAVTTQSATMNGTTAVTLAASNASIKVGQYISGTSIAADTYVAAISGTSLTLSKVASGSSTSTLSFYTPHGVVVGGGNNQATGAYSFIGGGGDAGTAANRNVASGDWSVVGGGRGNQATGGGSVIAGGGTDGTFAFANTATSTICTVSGGILNNATAYGAVIIGGGQNTSNGVYSTILGGVQGTARGISGYTVFSATNTPIANATGVSQAALLVLGVQTTDATATVLRSNTSAASTTNQVILPNNSAYYFRGEVVSGVTGGGNTKGFFIEGVIKRGANAASTTLVGTPTVTSNYADAGASAWTIAVTADTTNGGLAVTFTGQAGTTIRTVAQIRTTEMTF